MAFNQTSYGVDSAVSSQIEIHANFVGTGAANATFVSGKGVASVVWASTGKYTITFTNVGATYLGTTLTVRNSAQTAAGMKMACPCVYSASAKTLTIVIADLDKALADLSSSDIIEIHSTWSDSSVP